MMSTRHLLLVIIILANSLSSVTSSKRLNNAGSILDDFGNIRQELVFGNQNFSGRFSYINFNFLHDTIELPIRQGMCFVDTPNATAYVVQDKNKSFYRIELFTSDTMTTIHPTTQELTMATLATTIAIPTTTKLPLQATATISAETTKQQSTSNTCRVYFAESTIPNAGWGLFAGTSFHSNEEISVPGDAFVPILNFPDETYLLRTYFEVK
jgi:hypothetical protein